MKICFILILYLFRIVCFDDLFQIFILSNRQEKTDSHPAIFFYSNHIYSTIYIQLLTVFPLLVSFLVHNEELSLSSP